MRCYLPTMGHVQCTYISLVKISSLLRVHTSSDLHWWTLKSDNIREFNNKNQFQIRLNYRDHDDEIVYILYSPLLRLICDLRRWLSKEQPYDATKIGVWYNIRKMQATAVKRKTVLYCISICMYTHHDDDLVATCNSSRLNGITVHIVLVIFNTWQFQVIHRGIWINDCEVLGRFLL